MTDYPPEPWDLRGQQHVSTFLVPLGEIPAELPPGWRPVRVGRRGIVGTAWVSYEPGGVLSYSEVMATLLVRKGMRVLPTIVAIWVDSEISRDGGRGLWGIPKDLADFDVIGSSWSAVAEKGPIASSTVRGRRLLPWRMPVAFSIVQHDPRHPGQALVSPVRVRARVGVSSVLWDAARSGPLGFLAGRSPLVSFSLRDFRMSFGRAGR